MATDSELGSDTIRRAAEALSRRGTAEEGRSRAAVKRMLFDGGESSEGDPTPRDSGPAPPTGPPQRMGRYAVLEPIGRGGMGAVFRAYDPKLRREVALKVLRSGLEQHAEARLLREARAMAQLAHPNVLSVHDVESVGGSWCIVMEFVDGQTLFEWLRTQERSREDILEAFRAAGEGLAAAHDSGLVHRDFKPTNVLVGRDGRVRVMDFGLAKTAGEGLRVLEPVATGSVSETLTDHDIVLGTPAYMAPEQHLGRAADERSDQFSYCVALWEALTGHRPYAGSPPQDVAAGRVALKLPPDAGAVHRALSVGLSPDPDARFPAMRALLHALRPATRTPRSRIVVLGGLVAGAGVLAAWVAFGGDEVCQGGADDVDAVWGDARADVEAQMKALGSAYATEAWERVGAGLDAYAIAWADAHRDACEATRVRGEQSTELMDRRMACLGGHLAHVRALVNALRSGDAGVVRRSAAAVHKLPTLQLCADAEALLDQVPVPDDAGTRRRVEAVREGLAHANVLRQVGRFDEADAAVAERLVAAREIKYAPLEAEALRSVGLIQLDRQQWHDAADSLSAATWMALHAGHRREAAVASLDWLHVAAKADPDYERSMELAGWVQALLPPDEEDPLHSAYAIRVGMMLIDMGHYERGGKLLVAARDELEDHRASTLASIGNALAVKLLRTGHLPEARAELESALAHTVRAVGGHHPSAAIIITNLGNVRGMEGDYQAALVEFERALAIKEAAYGDVDNAVAEALVNIGSIRHHLGEREAAKAAIERARSIQERAFGKDHASLALTRVVLSEIAEDGSEEERRHLDEAVRLVYGHGAPGRPETSDVLMARVNLDLRAGRHDAAIAGAERALVYLGGEDPRRGGLFAALGEAQLRVGKTDRAAEALLQALPLLENAPGKKAAAAVLLTQALASG